MYSNKLFWKLFAKRTAICFFIFTFLFLFTILRIVFLSTKDYTAVQKNQNTLKLKAGAIRSTIYDRNLIPITNSDKKIIAAVSPTPRAITAISSVLEGDELQNLLKRLKSGKPVLCEVPEEINCDGIVSTNIYTNTTKIPAIHLIGYTNSDGIGVSGIEKAYDNFLDAKKDVTFYYECNGKGSILEGVNPTVENDTSAIASGVVTTIDINIQNIAEKAGQAIKTGAVVVAEAQSGKIRASVSLPDFNLENIAESLKRNDSPLLNRAINAYNVGSVFKPCIAAAATENKFQSFAYNCTGRCEIIDRFFKCHNINGHGYLNMNLAIANSCNTYFYNLAFNVGAENIYKTVSSLKFGKELEICDGLKTASGNIPSKETLSNIAQLANLSIGQGELLLSPISILTLYCSIASNGTYYTPSVVEGTLNEGSFKEYNIGTPTRVMKENTAEILRNHLASVVTEGTGIEAKPQFVSAAGKTATAQTGKFENGIEICEGWFCGFFPVENPKYVVIVFSENTLNQEKSCSKIFAEIADSITLLES